VQLTSIVGPTIKTPPVTGREPHQEGHHFEVNAEHLVNRQGVQRAEESRLDVIPIALGTNVLRLAVLPSGWQSAVERDSAGRDAAGSSPTGRGPAPPPGRFPQ
jgi:hypothetical protein